MSVEQLVELFSAENLTLLISVLSPIGLAIYNMKMQVDKVINKYKLNKTELQQKKLEQQQINIASHVSWQNETLLAIVQESKLSSTAKIDIITKYNNLPTLNIADIEVTETIEEVTPESFTEAATEVFTAAKDAVEEVGTNILGNKTS